MKIKSIMILTVLTLIASPVLADDHAHEDIVVGVSGTGQLKVEFDHWDEAHELDYVDGVIEGYLGHAPGFGHLETPEPAEDFYPLADGVTVYFEIISFESAFQAWGAGMSGPYSTPGDQLLLGDEMLHEHLHWHIDTTHPLYEEANMPFSAQFRLVDLGSTNYLPSETYELMFAPEPTTAVMLSLSLLALRRRR